MSLPIYELELKSIDAHTLATEATGTTINIKEILACAVQTVWSGGTSTSGTLYIEMSINGTDFDTVTSRLISTTSGSCSTNIERAGYPYIRAHWVPTAGSGGTMTSTFSAKRT